MYKFKMRLLSSEEDFFCTKTGLLNFKLTLPLAKLEMVSSKLISDGSIFFRWYSGSYPASNFLLLLFYFLLLLLMLVK